MTSQTKHYVELSDIIAVRGECRRCGATVSLPIGTNPLRMEGLRSCPNCNEGWAQFGGDTMELAIQKFMQQFIDVQGRLASLER